MFGCGDRSIGEFKFTARDGVRVADDGLVCAAVPYVKHSSFSYTSCIHVNASQESFGTTDAVVYNGKQLKSVNILAIASIHYGLKSVSRRRRRGHGKYATHGTFTACRSHTKGKRMYVN